MIYDTLLFVLLEAATIGAVLGFVRVIVGSTEKVNNHLRGIRS